MSSGNPKTRDEVLGSAPLEATQWKRVTKEGIADLLLYDLLELYAITRHHILFNCPWHSEEGEGWRGVRELLLDEFKKRTTKDSEN